MRKSIRLSIGFVFLLCYSFGQTTLEQGPIAENVTESIPEKMLGHDDNYFYMLKSNTLGKTINFFLEKYSISDYSLQYSKCINIEDNGKMKFIDAYYCGGKIFIFRRLFEKNVEEENKLLLQTVDENGNISKDLIEIFKINTPKMQVGVDLMGAKLGDPMMYSVYFDISVSVDTKNVLAVARVYKTTSETTLEKILKKIIDAENVSIKVDGEIPFHYDQSGFEPWNFKVDNNSNILFDFNYLNREGNTQSAIGLLKKNATSIVAMDLNFDRTKHKVEDIDFIVKGDNIYCSILYKNKVKIGEKTNLAPLFGVFTQRMDMVTLKPGKSDSLHFSKEVIEKLATGSSYYFRVYKIASIEVIDNDVYTIFEQTSLVRGALIVCRSEYGATINWIKIIPRNFDNNSRRNNQFHVYVGNKKLHFIFGESESILKKQSVDDLTMNNIPRSNYKNADIVEVGVDRNGTLTKNFLYKNNKMFMQFASFKSNMEDSFYTPISYNMIVPLKENMAIVYFENRNNEYKFGKVNFK